MPAHDLPASAFRPLAEAAASSSRPEPIFAAAEAFCRQHPGFQLLTILRYDSEAGEIERVHSTNLAVYPLKGRKPMGPTPWGDHVLTQGKPWLGNGAADIRWAYPDAELTLSMGREASFCVPVRCAGRTLGVLSMSDRKDSYDFGDAINLQLVAGLLVPALLMQTDGAASRVTL